MIIRYQNVKNITLITLKLPFIIKHLTHCTYHVDSVGQFS